MTNPKRLLYIFLFLIILIAPNIHSALADDLTHYYTYNSNANDSIGVINGTIVGATATTGKIDGAYSYDGVNDSINYNHIINTANANPISISVWVYITEQTGNKIFIQDDESGGGRGLQFAINLSGYFFVFTGVSTYFSNTTISTNTWYFLTATYDGAGVLKLYINGVEDVSYTGVTWLTDNDNLAYIGRDQSSTYFYKGKIDEVGVWEKALTSSEIQILYNSGEGNSYPFTIYTQPTSNKSSGNYYESFFVTLTQEYSIPIYYTLNGTDPDENSTLYTTPIEITATTTLKAIACDENVICSSIAIFDYVIKDAEVYFQFYDENTLQPLDDSVKLTDVTNNKIYFTNASGILSYNLSTLDWNNSYVNAYFQRQSGGVVTHTSRNLQFYYKNQDYNWNIALLPVNEGLDISFLVKDTNNEVWSNKFVQFQTSDGNIISSSLTNSTGNFTSYLQSDGNYVSVLYDATGTEGDTYIKTTVNVKKPKNEKSLADISPYDLQVGGLLIYSLTNQSAAQQTINIFGGTTSIYDFTVVDYNADPVDRVYIPRKYMVKNPFGSTYNPIYNLQPYLVSKEDGVIPSIVVYDELKTPFPDIYVYIYKYFGEELVLIEQKLTDSTGRTSFSGYPLDTYYIYLYENGTLKGSYNIEVRDTEENFYFVIKRDVSPDVTYRGLDLKYSWNNTPDYVNITTDDIDLNLSVYAYYVSTFDLNGYTIKAYQNSVLKETKSGALTGSSDDIIESLNKSNYTVAIPVIVVAEISFDYAGQTRLLTITKTIYVSDKTNGLLTILKEFPEKIGYLWTVLLSILITITMLVLIGTSDFIEKDYLIYVGLLILGFFVYIHWLSIGVEVMGIDAMWFIYIVTVIVAVGFALQDNQR